ncbi:MAG: hypothetical protein JO314_04205 [Acidobacteria bacterium]|nr:hypothetical protein [Acidobacteriota bacterium]
MSTKQIEYTDEPIGKVRIVEDLLPKAGELVFRIDQSDEWSGEALRDFTRSPRLTECASEDLTVT